VVSGCGGDGRGDSKVFVQPLELLGSEGDSLWGWDGYRCWGWDWKGWGVSVGATDVAVAVQLNGGRDQDLI